MRGLVALGVGWVLAACGPQVDIDDAGEDTDQGTAGSSASDGLSRGDETTTPVPPCPTIGCDDSGVPPNPTSATAMTTVSTTEPMSVSVTTDDPPPPGRACEDHLDCPTSLCLEYSDAPPDPEAYCENAPPDGATRITGTVRSISALAPVPNAYVVVASMLDAITNPAGATPLAEGFAGRAGLLDISSNASLTTQIGIVAIVDAPGFFLSGTAIATPDDDGTYLPGNDVHDIWLVSTQDLAIWSDQLAAELGPQPYLPLGEAGGFVGIVRAPDGMPRADVVVATESMESNAIVRYPTQNGLQATATSELGLFVIVNPALAENFWAMAPDGEATLLSSASTSGVVLATGVIL